MFTNQGIYGTEVKPEELSEQVVYKRSKNGNPNRILANYVYECEGNTKVYFDTDGTPFIIDSNLIRTDLTRDSSIKRYKKITIPQEKGSDWSYIELYQEINTGDWYYRRKNGEFDKKRSETTFDRSG